MADRIEVTKTNQFAALGLPAGSIGASKVTMFVLMMPGSDGGNPPSTRQAHVYAQIVRNG